MKKIVLVLFLFPVISFAQQKADYEHFVRRFVKYYNNGEADSINHMSRNNDGMWNNLMLQGNLTKYGKIKSFTYLGIDTTDPGKTVIFKIVFTKAGKKALGLTLDKSLYPGNFRFDTSDEEIERMLRASK